MLVRRVRVIPCQWLLPSKSRIPWRPRCRLSSSTAPEASSHSSSSTSPLASLTADLDLVAPRIDISADQIEIIDGPKEFYKTLRTKIKGAKHRIYLSTLYIGKSEHDLFATLHQALSHNPHLTVSILTDVLRGTRESPNPSCASLLASLISAFPSRVEVRMYHTPNLTGVRKVFIPQRINEGWGLQHIKLYGVDDCVILSGANLSHDYFTNRQDRYHLFTSKRVSDYYARIHAAVCSISCRLLSSSKPGGHALEWPETNAAPNPLQAPRKYIEAATALLAPLIEPQSYDPTPLTTDTQLYPLLTHPQSFNNELSAIKTLLARPITSYTITAGYFNPHPLITSYLLAASSPPISAKGTVLTASPFANGFFGSKGISGLLPAAYTYLSLRFLQAARGRNIQLREWQRGIVGQPNGWTYHAKGLWVTLPSSSAPPSPSNPSSEKEDNPGPSATLIGSSNYTTRSYTLDLEVGAVVVTSDAGLRKRWKREEEKLGDYTKVVSEEELRAKERRAGWRVRVAMWIVRVVGGAL